MYRKIFFIFSILLSILNAKTVIINSIEMSGAEDKDQKMLSWTFQCNFKKCNEKELIRPEIIEDGRGKIIKFSDVFYQALKDKNNQVIKSILGDINLLQKDNDFYIILQDNNLNVEFNNANLVITKLDPINNILNTNQSILSDNSYDVSPTKYISVIAFMIAIILILFLVRKKINKKKNISNLNYKQARIIDSKNKIIIIDYKDKSYILGVNPNGITLIDKIKKQKDEEEKTRDIRNEFKNLLKHRDATTKDL